MYIRKARAGIWKALGARELYEAGIRVEQIAVEMGVDSEATIRAWLRKAGASKAKHTAARQKRRAA